MNAEETIRDYYGSLSRGDSLSPYFVEDDSVVKFGIGERLAGYGEIESGLREQTATTENWRVESGRLRVTERDDYAWFSDEVRMAWTDTEAGEQRDFETRWSGTLERRDRNGSSWRFVGMHVSVAREVG